MSMSFDDIMSRIDRLYQINIFESSTFRFRTQFVFLIILTRTTHNRIDFRKYHSFDHTSIKRNIVCEQIQNLLNKFN